MKIPVMFRIDPTGHVIAVFPDREYSVSTGLPGSYQCYGATWANSFAPAGHNWILDDTKPARAHQYAELLDDLRKMYDTRGNTLFVAYRLTEKAKPNNIRNPPRTRMITPVEAARLECYLFVLREMRNELRKLGAIHSFKAVKTAARSVESAHRHAVKIVSRTSSGSLMGGFTNLPRPRPDECT